MINLESELMQKKDFFQDDLDFLKHIENYRKNVKNGEEGNLGIDYLTAISLEPGMKIHSDVGWTKVKAMGLMFGGLCFGGMPVPLGNESLAQVLATLGALTAVGTFVYIGVTKMIGTEFLYESDKFNSLINEFTSDKPRYFSAQAQVEFEGL